MAEAGLIDDVVCDPLCGIVRRCFELPLEADDPRVFCFVSEAAPVDRFGTGQPKRSPLYGCGVALSRAAAAGAAVGEVMERYSAAFYDPVTLRRSSFAQLEGEAADPESFALFSAAQHACFRAAEAAGEDAWPRPFTRETRTAWVSARSLVTGRPVWVPAAFVYLPYHPEPGEEHFADAVSTGLACARTLEEAVLGALLEVVERDAVTILWQNALAPPRLVDAAPLTDSRLACRGTRWMLLDATLDLPLATVVAVLIDDRGGTAVGSATRLHPAEAARKAMLEAAQVRVACKREMVTGSPRRYAANFSDVRDFADHARLYSRRDMRPALELVWDSERERPFASLPSPGTGDVVRDLEYCVALLADRGLEPLLVEVTSDDVREAGYRVVRVVVPGMEMLHARHNAPFLGGRRLRDVPVLLGLRRAPAEAGELNPLPHPFP
jgi:ribosomal protein S12 methylthiotransferase accessory factor